MNFIDFTNFIDFLKIYLAFNNFPVIILSMEYLVSILPYIQIALAILLTALILLQQTGNELGGAFGGGDNFSARHTRRGAEKALFNITIIVGILFVASTFVALIA